MATITDRLQKAWNAFLNRSPTDEFKIRSNYEWGSISSTRPDRLRMSRRNERSIVTSIYNRIAMDVSSVNIRHVRLDENLRYIGEIDSGLNNCLKLEANDDQTCRAFMQDVVMSMFDEGCVAVVPTDTKVNPMHTDSYDILKLRTGKILEWYPQHVKVKVFNERSGKQEDIVLPKRMVGIIENPFYSVMNEPNSTLQRLIRKLNILDAIDEQSGAGKLDIIIQLPYTIKTEARKQQADLRRKDIENQLKDSKYGIAYTDATEKVTQLNRPVENNLMKQIEFLTTTLYSQLGLSQTILDGTADEKTLLNYNNRTVEPILSAITLELERKFLTKTGRTQGQAISFFRDPFRLVPINNIAEIADKFTRNEIMTSNEIRQIVGMMPADDPNADVLLNKNLNQGPIPMEEAPMEEAPMEEAPMEEEPMEEEPMKITGDTLVKDIKKFLKE